MPECTVTESFFQYQRWWIIGGIINWKNSTWQFHPLVLLPVLKQWKLTCQDDVICHLGELVLHQPEDFVYGTVYHLLGAISVVPLIRITWKLVHCKCKIRAFECLLVIPNFSYFLNLQPAATFSQKSCIILLFLLYSKIAYKMYRKNHCEDLSYFHIVEMRD